MYSKYKSILKLIFICFVLLYSLNSTVAFAANDKSKSINKFNSVDVTIEFDSKLKISGQNIRNCLICQERIEK